MNKKRTGIILCLTALAVLTGMLVFQGIRQSCQPETEKATGAALAASATDMAVPAHDTDGQTAITGAVISDTGRTEGKTEGQEKKSPAANGNDRTPAPAGLGKSSGSSASGTKQTAEPGKTAKPKSSTQEKTTLSDKNTQNDKKVSPVPSPSAATPVPSPNTATSVPVGETEKKVRMTIQCTGILDYRELWKDGIEEIVPADGIFYAGECDLGEGDTVYDILKKICKEKNIALDSQYTPVYGTYYIQGIGNLYEFDCGSESGWKYSVNGKVPGEGCSSYRPDDGDDIIFYYDYKL